MSKKLSPMDERLLKQDDDVYQLLNVHAKLSSTGSAIKRHSRKREAILAAAAMTGAERGEDVSARLDRELDLESEQFDALNRERFQDYLAFRKAIGALRSQQRALRKVLGARTKVVRPLRTSVSNDVVYVGFNLASAAQAQIANCTPHPVTQMSLLRYLLLDDTVLTHPPDPKLRFLNAPTREQIEASAAPPAIKLHVWGGNDGDSPGGFAFGDVIWGIDVASVGCGVEVGANVEVSGLVNIESGGSPVPQVVNELNVEIAQFRNLGVPIAQVDIFSVPAYTVWRAYPEASFEQGNPDQSVESAPGVHSITPFEAAVDQTITDVQVGDAFAFRFLFSVAATRAWVDYSWSNIGLLVLWPPGFYRYDPV